MPVAEPPVVGEPVLRPILTLFLERGVHAASASKPAKADRLAIENSVKLPPVLRVRFLTFSKPGKSLLFLGQLVALIYFY